MEVALIKRRPNAWLRFLRALPVGVGGIVIGLVRLGVVGVVVVLAVILPLLTLIARGGVRLGRRRANKVGARVSAVLAAEASLERKPGVVFILRDAVRWEGRRTASVIFRSSEIQRAEVTPVGGFLLRATRVRLVHVDGRDTRLAITAPLREVEPALRQLA